MGTETTRKRVIKYTEVKKKMATKKERTRSYPIKTIEGINKVHAGKLARVGIKTTGALLKHSITRKDREELAKKAGISKKLILEWTNLSDLLRIKGVGEEYSDMLEEVGVDTVKELKMRNVGNLYPAIKNYCDKSRLVRKAPSERQVASWITQAKVMRPMLKY